MRKELKNLYREVARNGYGPRPSNPIYEITAKDGRLFKVERHKWAYPSNRWAWRAEPKDGKPVFSEGVQKPVFYEDTLTDLAVVLGYVEVEE